MSNAARQVQKYCIKSDPSDGSPRPGGLRMHPFWNLTSLLQSQDEFHTGIDET